jgi:hypothetical protein
LTPAAIGAIMAAALQQAEHEVDINAQNLVSGVYTRMSKPKG